MWSSTFTFGPFAGSDEEEPVRAAKVIDTDGGGMLLSLFSSDAESPPLLLLGPRTILKELSRFSVGMVTMGVELS